MVLKIRVLKIKKVHIIIIFIPSELLQINALVFVTSNFTFTSCFSRLVPRLVCFSTGMLYLVTVLKYKTMNISHIILFYHMTSRLEVK